MKNFIVYFYNINPEKIVKSSEDYYIYSREEVYIFKENNRKMEEIYSIYNLLKNDKKFHKIIINKYGNIISRINNKDYIMMRLIHEENRKIEISDIYNIQKIKLQGNYISLARSNWRELWMNRIDYIENNIAEYKNELLNYIDYNIGLTETAIQLLVGMRNFDLVLSHIKLTEKTTIHDLYDPTNIILDSRVRDIVEYYRNLIDEDIKYINNISLEMFDEEEKKLFFTRFLYNKKYFDSLNIEDSKAIKKVTDRISSHELAIKKLYNQFANALPEIEWLKKTS